MLRATFEESDGSVLTKIVEGTCTADWLLPLPPHLNPSMCHPIKISVISSHVSITCHHTLPPFTPIIKCIAPGALEHVNTCLPRLSSHTI